MSSISPGNIALVTGASSGIGAAFSLRLARDGYKLILVARRGDRLEDLAARCRKEYGVECSVLPADLSTPDGLQAVEERIEQEAELSLLVNNAGFGAYMPFASLSAERAEESIRLQVLALTRLTRAALPKMIERGSGALVNVSSRLGFSGGFDLPGMPRRAVYAAAKAYVTAFTQILAGELAGTGVRVQALCPGLVRTEFHKIQGVDPDRFPASLVMTPEDVVEASLRGLAMGEVVCIPALEEAELLEREQDVRRQLLESSATGRLASRYRG